MKDHLKNPLLSPASRPPHFDAVEPDHVEPGIRALVAEVSAMLERLEKSAEPSWKGVVEPIERMQDRLGFGWGVVEHLMSVKNSEELRTAYERVESEVVRLSMRMGQSTSIFRALVALRDGEKSDFLDAAQKRILDKLIQDAEHSGVALKGKKKKRFQEIKLELAELSTRFGNHLLDATKAFELVLQSKDEVSGLPQSYLEMAAQSARLGGESGASASRGPWRITLDGPSFVGFMKHGSRRDLREKLHRAFVARASEGEFDNQPLIEAILRLRREEAALLGYSTYAELSLSKKMAGTVDRAERLLEELRGVAYDAAHREMDELRFFKREQGESEEVCHWDVTYWSERMREARFDYSEEVLRSYFPMPRVLEGLFALARRLFEIEVVSADAEAPVWHQDVRYFRVRSLEGEDLAAFYLDPYSRPHNKRGGAWMNEVVGRSHLFAPKGQVARLPVAHLICNGTAPVDGKPSLMTFREIEALFHEFGHTLQHMLTSVNYGLASGIRNVDWDAVELPSQFMENWCYHRETILGLSSHVETGAPLPDVLFDKICAARTFQSGMTTLRQLYFGFLDLCLHHRYEGGEEGSTDVQRRIAARTTVLPPLPEDRFLCGFSHIFQGGYAAGYYSYKWAEVLSADAFAAFEEAGLNEDQALRNTGCRFRDTVLSLGGSASPMEVFRQFRDREPSTEALLRHSGLVVA